MPPPAPRRRQGRNVLAEEDYVEAVGDIIERDFFPDLKLTRAQAEVSLLSWARHIAKSHPLPMCSGSRRLKQGILMQLVWQGLNYYQLLSSAANRQLGSTAQQAEPPPAAAWIRGTCD